MSSRHHVHRTEAWQRFSLLDILALHTSASVSLSVCCATTSGRAEMGQLMAAGIFGLAFFGPIVLAAQCTLRRRSRPLSVGEWLWLSPTALYLLLWLALRQNPTGFSDSGGSLLALWFLAQVTCVGVAVATLAGIARGYRSTVPCYWTDCSGSIASLLCGLWTLCWVLPGLVAC